MEKMPKKMGVNSKAVEARERKLKMKKVQQDKLAREAEDNHWQDNDRNLLKKQNRREEEERKRADAAKRKAEAKIQLDQEISSITTQGKQSLAKINRLQILDEMDKKQRAIDAINMSKQQATGRVIIPQAEIEENLNRAMADTLIATNVNEALSILTISSTDNADKHPEKRMRAAYKSFESTHLPRIKSENPSLRMSQWKQILMKEWNKSPQNPFNEPN